MFFVLFCLIFLHNFLMNFESVKGTCSQEYYHLSKHCMVVVIPMTVMLRPLSE